MLGRIARREAERALTRARSRLAEARRALERRFRLERWIRSQLFAWHRHHSGFFTKHADGEELLFVLRWHDVRRVLDAAQEFPVAITGARMAESIGPFFLGMDPPPGATASSPYVRESTLLRNALDLPDANAPKTDHRWKRLVGIQRKAEELADGCVRRALTNQGEIDVVQDLADALPLAFAEWFFGVPGQADEEGTLGWLRSASSYVFGVDVASRREAAATGGRAVATFVRSVVDRRDAEKRAGRPVPDDVLDRLLASCPDRDVVARCLTGTLSGTLIPTAWIFIEAVERLLRLGARQRADLARRAQAGDRAGVRAYVLEAARFYPFPPVLLRRAAQDTTVGGRRVAAGQGIVLLLTAASMDPRAFPHPRRFVPGRPETDGLLFGHGVHECAGRAIGEILLTEMAMALFARRGIRRAAGLRGYLDYGDRPHAIPDGPYPKHLFLEANGWSA